MRRIILVAGVVLVALFGAVLVLPGLVPSSVYKAEIERAGTAALGRTVAIAGDVRLSVFPRIEARARGASIANPEGFGDTPFASMGELRAAVRLWPLVFAQRVEVAEFVLIEPSIALIETAEGANNWTFAPGAPAETGESGAPPAALGDVRIRSGRLTWRSDRVGDTHELSGFDLSADLRALDKPARITSSGRIDDLPFSLDAEIGAPAALLSGERSPLSVDLDTELLTVRLDGELAWAGAASFDFAFSGGAPSAVALAEAFGVDDLPGAKVLGELFAEGRASGGPSDILLRIDRARHASPLATAEFTGEVRFAEEISVAGQASAEAPKLAELAAALDIPSPGSAVLGSARATTKIAGKAGDLAFSGIDFRHEGGLIGLTFEGGARLTEDVAYDGRVTLAAPDLRTLAQATGATLPDGPVYRSFLLTGEASGSANDLKLRNAVLEFDAIRATGEAALAFAAKPRLIGRLSSGPIDLTPYAAASGAPPEDSAAKGWSTEPIDLAPLRLIDADLVIDAEALRYDAFRFGPTELIVALRDGLLEATLGRTTLFEGAGSARLVADARGPTPSFFLDARMQDVSLAPFLAAAADFDRMTGAGNFEVSFAGSGGDVRSLMNSLSGDGKFTLADGLIKGVDIPLLVRGARQALANKSIPVAAFGRDAKTPFGAVKASFSMKDGVAAMSDMLLTGSGFTVAGGGSLDLGEQSLGLSLYPEFRDKSLGVDGVGLPVRFSGAWEGVEASIDFDWLIQRAAGKAKERAADEIQRELRRRLGSDLGSVLLGPEPARGTAPPAPQPPAPAAPDSPPPQSPAPPDPPGDPPSSEPAAPPAEPPSLEDQAREEVRRRLGDLLRRN